MAVVWTQVMDDEVRRRFPFERAADIAKDLGVSERTVFRKAKELGVKKSDDVKRKAWMTGIREIQYQWLCGRKAGPPKGKRTNPGGEFKKGHRFTGELEEKRVKAIRDRAWDERVRIIRGWRRKTGWKMKSFGNDEGNS